MKLTIIIRKTDPVKLLEIYQRVFGDIATVRLIAPKSYNDTPVIEIEMKGGNND